MASVFINYRSDDEKFAVELIHDDLSRRFGDDEVFLARKSIAPGRDFEQELPRGVRRSAVLLAVIGPHWLTVRDRAGRRKVDLESDWTRREILEAFDCGITVIPVLIGKETKRLSANDLPAELGKLARCQELPFDEKNPRDSLARIAAAVIAEVPGLTDRTAAPKAPPRAAGETNVVRKNARVGNIGSGHADNRDAIFGDHNTVERKP